MKKLIITCALVSIASTVTFAQASKTNNATTGSKPAAANYNTNISAEQMAERHAKAYEKQLGLSAEQYKAVYAAELNYYQQDKAARANGQAPGEGQAMQMNMGRDQQINAVLTDGQKAKYASMKPSSTPAAKH